MSLISQISFNRIKDKQDVKILPVTNTALNGAFGKNTIKIKKQVFVPIKIGNSMIQTILLVVNDLNFEIILGFDWILENNVIIDAEKKIIQVQSKILKHSDIHFSNSSPHTNNYSPIVQMAVCSTLSEDRDYSTLQEKNDKNNFFLELGNNNRFSSESDSFENALMRKINQISILNTSEKMELKNLLIEFKDVFSEKPGKIKNFTYEIKLNNQDPIIRKSYAIPLAYKQKVLDEIQRMLDNGIIERDSSPYCNPLRVVLKKSGKVRLCLDARQLNKYIESDVEKPPKIDEIIQNNEGRRFFTSTDMTEGYFQVPLSKNSRKYTAFVVDGKTYVFCRVPFGMKVSGSVFLRALNSIFTSNDDREFITLYVDDGIIRSRSFEEHISHLRYFLMRLKESGLTLNLDKTLFCQEKIPFLGFILSAEGVSPDPGRIDAILNMPEPRNRKELQSCIGVCNYYRIFSKHYAVYIDPFRKLLSEKHKFVWEKEHHDAFENLKAQFAKHILLNHYLVDRPFYLQTDASKQGISGVLYQYDDENNQRIVAVVSRCLTNYESNYSTSELELLAIVYSVLKLKYYLLGKKFKIKTDHQALIFLLKTSFYTARLMRWTLILQQFDYDVEHCKGSDNIIADYFSRNPPEKNASVIDLWGKNDSFLNDGTGSIKVINAWFPEFKHFKEMQKQDEFISNIKSKIENDKAPEYRIYNDLIFHKYKQDKNWKLVVPYCFQERLVHEMHLRIGHGGLFKTLSEIKKSFWWVRMRKTIKNSIKCCDICQRTKYLNKTMSGRFLQIKAERPNQLVAVDYFGPLPRSVGGAEYIFVMLDICTRYVSLYALKKATARATIGKVRDYFAKVGKPSRILSDHGTQFMSRLWQDFLRESGVEAVYCSIRHPEANPSERVMRELNKFFRIYCHDRHTAWAKHLAQINYWLNFTTHSTTGFTPYELQFGEAPGDKLRKLIKFPDEIAEPREIKIELAKLRTDKRHKQQKERQATYSVTPIKIGDLVLLRVPKPSNLAEKKISKFFLLYYGPYRINRAFNDNAFELADVNDPSSIIGHYNRADLRLYHELNRVD